MFINRQNKIRKENSWCNWFFYGTKIIELENKIPDVSSFLRKIELTAVENEIPSISSLDKKATFDTKISELEKNLLIIIMTNMSLLQSLIV